MITILQSAIPSKNAKVVRLNRGTRKAFIAKNSRALTSENSIMWQLAAAKNKREWERMIWNKTGENQIWDPDMHAEGREILEDLEIRLKALLRIQFKYYRPNHQRFDYLNAAAILCDCLVKQHYLIDDSAQVMLPVFEPYEIDAKNPRVEITIL